MKVRKRVPQRVTRRHTCTYGRGKEEKGRMNRMKQRIKEINKKVQMKKKKQKERERGKKNTRVAGYTKNKALKKKER